MPQNSWFVEVPSGVTKVIVTTSGGGGSRIYPDGTPYIQPQPKKRLHHAARIVLSFAAAAVASLLLEMVARAGFTRAGFSPVDAASHAGWLAGGVSTALMLHLWPERIEGRGG
jgi:hypothetical protein